MQDLGFAVAVKASRSWDVACHDLSQAFKRLFACTKTWQQMGVATRFLRHGLYVPAWLFHVVCRPAWMFFVHVITATVTTSHFMNFLTLRRQGRPYKSLLRFF